MLINFDNLLRSGKYLDAKLPAELHPCHRDDLIRLGAEGDGGYVLTKTLLDYSDFLISCGLSHEWSFEKTFFDAKKTVDKQCVIHGYDPTIDLAALEQRRKRSSMLKLFSRRHRILSSFHYDKFFDNSRIKHFSSWVRPHKNGSEQTDIKQMIERAKLDNAINILLKMDIEGNEYDCLVASVNDAAQFSGIVCEFHDTASRRTQFLDLVRLYKQHFRLVHIAANNNEKLTKDHWPPTLELTFENIKLRPDANIPSTHNYPISGRDFRNRSRSADYRLSFAD